MSLTKSSWTDSDGGFQRPLGDSEFAFFPASQNALGDMFLHVAFRAPINMIRKKRVQIAWSIIRSRHPLLMSKVVLNGDDLNSAHFCFKPPANALEDAGTAMLVTNQSRERLILNFMNGPRTLSNDRLSYLVISTSPSSLGTEHVECDFMMCAPHFIGDGTSLHQSTHDLLCLIASSKSDDELSQELLMTNNWVETLPPAFETRLPTQITTIGKAAARINFIQTLQNEIGGQTLPRTKCDTQRTTFLERAFTEEQTAKILARCKANKVTVNHAFTALCNIAWGRNLTSPESKHLPMMIYTAINLRSRLSSHTASTYWFIPLTYYNIVLPSFLPATPAAFWHRARLAKAQTHRTVYSPFLAARAIEMASIRASRARGVSSTTSQLQSQLLSRENPPPSSALLGLSLIGNLDRVYTRASYPSLHLHSVTTASRLKPGGILLLEHTFGGKLWFQLFWDELGFETGRVERFWEELGRAVEDYLC